MSPVVSVSPGQTGAFDPSGLPVATVTGAWTLVPSEFSAFMVDATNGAFAATLPNAAAWVGAPIVIKAITATANLVTLQPAGSDLIDGAPLVTLGVAGTYPGVSLVSDGVQWRATALHGLPAAPTAIPGTNNLQIANTAFVAAAIAAALGLQPVPAPAHIEVWAYDEAVGNTFGPTIAHQWLTHAMCESGGAPSYALADSDNVHTFSWLYLDTNWVWSAGVTLYNLLVTQGQASENWWLHTTGFSDAGHRLTGNAFGTGYCLNHANPAVRAWIANYVATNAVNNINAFYGIFMDDQAGNLVTLLFPAAGSPATCNEFSTDAQLQAAQQALAAQILHTNGTPFPQVNNGQSPNPYLPKSGFPLLGVPAAVAGFIYEGWPWNSGNGNLQNFFSSLLDDMAYLCHTFTQGFMVLLQYDTTNPAQGRRIACVTQLLGYQPGRIILWPRFEVGSPAVYPEQGIYPTLPIQTMGTPSNGYTLTGAGTSPTVGGHNDIKVAGGTVPTGLTDLAPGVYRREFQLAYYQGASIGPLCVVMNYTNAAVTIQGAWLTQSYGHSITFNGGDVVSGGTLNLQGATFTPGTTTIPAGDAILLAS